MKRALGTWREALMHGRRRHGRLPHSAWLGFALFGVLAASAATPVFAAGNTLRLLPASISTIVGAPFTVSVVGNSEGPVSGTQASVVFDTARLEVMALAKGAAWTAQHFAGFQSPTGTFAAMLPARSRHAAFTDGERLAAGDQVLTVTFR